MQSTDEKDFLLLRGAYAYFDAATVAAEAGYTYESAIERAAEILYDWAMELCIEYRRLPDDRAPYTGSLTSFIRALYLDREGAFFEDAVRAVSVGLGESEEGDRRFHQEHPHLKEAVLGIQREWLQWMSPREKSDVFESIESIIARVEAPRESTPEP